MKKIYPLIPAFIITIALFMAVLLASAQIPQRSIQKNMESSAEYLCAKPVFFELVDGVAGSQIDRYADSILLNIVYHYDGSMASVMNSAYYYTDTQNENENLRDAVEQDLPANQQYLRYWHGSAVIVRVCHLFTDIRGMYIFNGFLLAVGVLGLLALLYRNRQIGTLVAEGFAFIIGSVWFTPFCLEYIWTILIAVYVAVIALAKKGRDLYVLFLLSGMLAAYFDFLTTETLTLLMPMMLLIAVEERTDLLRRNIVRGVAWTAGYVLTWLSKWCIAALVLQENVMPYVTENAKERLGGSLGLSLPQYLSGAVVRNLGCLFPLEYGVAGVFGVLALLVFVGYRLYVYRKDGADKQYITIIVILAFVPFLRFLILHNHSYLHFFFTFRALMATVLGIGLVVCELTRRET